jgi:Family of unknown function (DUF6491)
MRTLTAIILAAFLASACATTGGGLERSKGEKLYSRYEPYLGEPVHSFTALQHDSWQPISRTQLVLWTTFDDAYLLTVTGNCYDLPFAQTVGVTSTASAISTLDSVIVRGNRCPITQIQPIDVERMKADRHLRALEENRRAMS